MWLEVVPNDLLWTHREVGPGPWTPRLLGARLCRKYSPCGKALTRLIPPHPPGLCGGRGWRVLLPSCRETRAESPPHPRVRTSEGPCAGWESCFFSKPALLSFHLSPKVCPIKDPLVFPEKFLLFLENRPQLLTNQKFGAQALERMEERVSAPVFGGGRGRGQHTRGTTPALWERKLGPPKGKATHTLTESSRAGWGCISEILLNNRVSSCNPVTPSLLPSPAHLWGQTAWVHIRALCLTYPICKMGTRVTPAP